jgi:cobalt-zinc-cadmium efflux system protein
VSGTHAHPTATNAATSRDRQRRVLWIALAANGLYMVVEIVGGIAFNSLALLADATHMLSDVVGLGLALAAHSLATRPPTQRHTYGFQRAEVLGALANGALLVATSAWIVIEAVRRLGETVDIDGPGMLAVATVGLVVNVVSAVLLARAAGRSLNMRGAFLHMAADAAGSLSAIAAAFIIIAGGPTWTDSAASILIAVLVLWAAWSLVQSALRVLLEGTPSHLDPDAVRDAIAQVPGVGDVHHLHLWSLASDTPALSVHITLESPADLHGAQLTADVVRQRLHERFEIDHATIEVECHDCADEPSTTHVQDCSPAPASTTHAAGTSPAEPSQR